MKKGELYKTKSNQHRLILGTTPRGDVAFATRGGNIFHDYSQCQIQPQSKFDDEAEFVGVVPQVDFQRVLDLFAKYIAENKVS